ncbi:DUF3800 domain-containing protein [Corynebacterium sp. 153RC1]|uniref:DUF3800 domain-containing protein n=1 Tax=unclassified Corynebacterium TaxID=2624378 RepID=UPI00211C42C1|nr:MULTISPECIES: DUF3800 domain-containing protein [unclassified Corynebacterium]MCQ9371691.1 DUF3800 domain-containing protein [Corynebacterium sp. 35RC1]MCQ9353459.1 DUF3800 domain-containing protein [Corynebacterium sp. 209RC1]MCQ9355695.1 DUF3800 domain-containing protein [Corynebacterium sp. 1222RC1]MCQ9356769.1 DUF3800 domain-containing protein [Corynebacterium sp. 122RC1]MCQ9360063.1 DUF3800 domain-containing protein [Corynebacterium sp. 142RC1]
MKLSPLESSVLPPKITLPEDAVGAVYFIDEAGSKGTLGKHFVTGAVKTADPDRLSRAVKACRDRNRFTGAEEIKFSKVTKNSEPILAEIFREAVAAECRFGAFVLDKRHFDPWSSKKQWQGHLFATDRLLRGLVTRREISIALLDHIDVPEGISYGDELMKSCNTRFGNKRIASAVSLDSRTCSGLQIADLLASAVFHARKKIEENGLERFLEDQSPKARLSRDIAAALGVSHFSDCSTDLLRVQTSHEQSLTELRKGGSL